MDGPSTDRAVEPITADALPELVAARLRQLIGDGTFGPGDKLVPERLLAAQLGVSRTSLRLALGALRRHGLLEVRHGSGTYVSADALDLLSTELADTLARQNADLPAIMEARRALETEAAALAARRRGDADLEALAAALEQMGREVAADEQGAAGDARFHEALWDAAHSPVLRGLLRDLSGDVARLRSESLAQPGRPRRSLAAHERVLGQVRAGDADGARRAMAAHLDEVGDVLLVLPTSSTLDM